MNQVDCEIEALDEFGVLDASDQQLCHLHFEEVLWQTLELVMVDLKLNCEQGLGIRTNFENGRKAEEGHAVKDDKLLLFEGVSELSGFRLH